jgi:predicted RNA-binding Zn ribbon-like protein
MEASALGPVSLVGGRPALDFANTVDWHAGPNPEDKLLGYADLVEWSRQAGLVDDDEAAALVAEAVARPAEAAAALARAREVRELVYDVFAAVASGETPDGAGLARLNGELAAALGQARLVAGDGGFVWGWAPRGTALDAMLRPILRDAAELLTSPELDRVGQCAGDPCGWLFLDTSRNRSRRWCDMRDCGNRAKAQRHYRRQRASAPVADADS